MGSVSSAISSAAREAGATILTEAEVSLSTVVPYSISMYYALAAL